MSQSIETLVTKLAQLLIQKQLKLVTAESCTGGGLAFYLTNLAGSSAWFDRGFITYSNQSKQDLLDVDSHTLAEQGAVSEETAREMAEGALQNSEAGISVAITGIAGPEGGSPEKPVGTVWFGLAKSDVPTLTWLENFTGDRFGIREQAIRCCLEKLLAVL